MFKKKQSEKQPVPVQEVQKKNINPKQKKRRNRRIFRLIILTLLVGFGWAGYHNLKQKSMMPAPKTKTPIAIQSAKSIPVIPNKTSINDMRKSVLFQSDSNPFKEDEVPTLPSVKPDEETSQNENAPEISDTTVAPVSEPISDEDASLNTNTPEQLEQQIEQALSDTDAHTYTLRDALAFRDHFLSERPCGDDFRKLILSDNKTDIVQEVIQSTTYFCLTTNNVYGELSGAFVAAKQNALIRHYYQQDGEWMAKIKSAISQLIQIRNLNPVTDDVPSIMDKAHNALDAKNITLATQLVVSLPKELQNDFEPFLEKAKNYADAAQSLEQLILSYAKGE